MRRVSIANAAEGMVLKAPVYDVKGMPVLEIGETLTEAKLPLLARTLSAEILVEDPRTEDIPVGTMFPPDLEAKASQALNVLMVMQQGVTSGIQQGGLMGLVPPLNKLVNCLYPDMMGDADISGSYTLNGYHYVHPIKVAELSMVIARFAGAERKELLTLGMAAALMNIGYLNLKPGLLEQPRALEPPGPRPGAGAGCARRPVPKRGRVSGREGRPRAGRRARWRLAPSGRCWRGRARRRARCEI